MMLIFFIYYITISFNKNVFIIQEFLGIDFRILSVSLRLIVIYNHAMRWFCKIWHHSWPWSSNPRSLRLVISDWCCRLTILTSSITSPHSNDVPIRVIWSIIIINFWIYSPYISSSKWIFWLVVCFYHYWASIWSISILRSFWLVIKPWGIIVYSYNIPCWQCIIVLIFRINKHLVLVSKLKYFFVTSKLFLTELPCRKKTSGSSWILRYSLNLGGAWSFDVWKLFGTYTYLMFIFVGVFIVLCLLSNSLLPRLLL